MAVAYRSATSATDLAPAEPAGATADDIILAVYSNENTAATLTPATGFTQINYDTNHGANSGVGQHATHWIRRGGSAIANDWADGGAGGRVCLICYSGCKTTGSPINASSYAEGSDGTIEHATITTTVDNCMIVGLSNQWNWGTGTSTDFANERIDQAEAVFIYDDGLLVTAGATGSMLVTSTGSVWGATLVALEPADAAAPAGLTADPSMLAGFFILNQRQLSLWEGSPGPEVAADITVDSAVSVGVASSSQATVDIAVDANAEVGAVARSGALAELTVVGLASVGAATRAGATAEPSAATTVAVGVQARTTPTVDITFTSSTWVGVAPYTQPSADTDITVASRVQLGVVAWSQPVTEPSAAARMPIGMLTRSTVTPEVVAVTVGLVGVTTRSTVTPTITTATAAAIGIHTRSSPTVQIVAVAQLPSGLYVASGVVSVEAAVAARVLVGVTLRTILTEIAAILVDRVEVWTEPGPPTWTEPPVAVWSEPAHTGWAEPASAVWAEPAPTEGVSL